VTEKQIVMRT